MVRNGWLTMSAELTQVCSWSNGDNSSTTELVEELEKIRSLMIQAVDISLTFCQPIKMSWGRHYRCQRPLMPFMNRLEIWIIWDLEKSEKWYRGTSGYFS
jgi:hypothetical protein